MITMKYKHCHLCCVKNITVVTVYRQFFNNNRSKSNKYIRIFFKNWKTGSCGENLEKEKVNFTVDEYDGETL